MNGRFKWIVLVSAALVAMTTTGTLAYREVQFRESIHKDIERGDRLEKDISQIHESLQLILLNQCIEIKDRGQHRLPDECVNIIIRSHQDEK